MRVPSSPMAGPIVTTAGPLWSIPSTPSLREIVRMAFVIEILSSEDVAAIHRDSVLLFGFQGPVEPESFIKWFGIGFGIDGENATS